MATTPHEAFFARSPDPCCVVGPDGRLERVNPAWERALGFAAEELVATPLLDWVHPDDRARSAGALGALGGEGRGAAALECRLRCKPSGYKRLSLRCAPIPVRGGVVASGREAAPAGGAARRLEALVRATPHLVGLAEPDGRIAWMNPAGRAMLGVREEEVRSRTLFEFLTPRAARQLEVEMGPAVARDGFWAGESALQTANGVALPVSSVLLRLEAGAGQQPWLATITRDLRAQKRAEAELRRFEALADGTSDLVATATIAGETTYVNSAGMRMLGRGGGDFRRLRLEDVVPRASLPRFRAEVFRAVRDHGIWSGEPDLMRADGTTFPVSQVVLLVRDERGEPSGYGSIARDLTLQRRMERALEEALRALSTPILQVEDGVLALPVVGFVDAARAARLTEALLEAIVATECRVAILDLSGMEEAEAPTMAHLGKLVKAAALLGSRCVVAGISAAAARTLTELGLDLARVRTFGTLEDALRSAALPAGAARGGRP